MAKKKYVFLLLLQYDCGFCYSSNSWLVSGVGMTNRVGHKYCFEILGARLRETYSFSSSLLIGCKTTMLHEAT